MLVARPVGSGAFSKSRCAPYRRREGSAVALRGGLLADIGKGTCRHPQSCNAAGLRATHICKAPEDYMSSLCCSAVTQLLRRVCEVANGAIRKDAKRLQLAPPGGGVKALDDVHVDTRVAARPWPTSTACRARLRAGPARRPPTHRAWPS